MAFGRMIKKGAIVFVILGIMLAFFFTERDEGKKKLGGETRKRSLTEMESNDLESAEAVKQEAHEFEAQLEEQDPGAKEKKDAADKKDKEASKLEKKETRERCIKQTPGGEFKKLEETCERIKEDDVSWIVKDYPSQRKPVLLAMFGGIANVNSWAKDAVVERLVGGEHRLDSSWAKGSTDERFNFVELGKSELTTRIPEYKTFVKEKDRTVDCQVSANYACRTSIPQDKVLKLAVEKQASWMIEWTNPSNLREFANNELEWTKGIQNYTIAFVLVTVKDFSSVEVAEAERALKTGMKIDATTLRKYNTDMNENYLRTVKTLIDENVGEIRRFLVLRRCTAGTSDGELVDITDKITSYFSEHPSFVPSSKEADELMSKMVPLSCDEAPALA